MQKKDSRYRIEREIGRGAFGVVYLANDNLLRRKVALKVISIPDGLSPGERDHLVERFYREARAAAGLSHQNIVIIHDISKAGDRHFISMEFLEGQPLSEAMGGEPLSVDRSLQIADQVLLALEYAHSCNVVHRDIKPDNIFLLPGDRVKLVDFGLARVQATTTITKSGAVMGSPGYIAPEVVEGKQADSRTDIFSFGVAFYEMLTGERPFGPRTAFESFIHVIYRIMSEEPPAPSSMNADVPPELDAVVSKCLAKDPDERFQDAGELRRAMTEAAGRGVAVAEEEPAAEPTTGGEGVKVGPVPTTEIATAATLDDSEREAEKASGVTESVVEGWDDAPTPAGKTVGRNFKWWLIGAAAVIVTAGAVVLGLVLAGVLGGGNETAVPNLINLGREPAVKALGEAGLKVGKVTKGFSYDIWKDKIMKQMPSAGTKVQKESSVDFVVSLGSDVVQVPDVVNQPEAAAEQTLVNFGFNVKKESAFKRGFAVGYVFETRPAPGSLESRGTQVTIVINTGQPTPSGDSKNRPPLPSSKP